MLSPSQRKEILEKEMEEYLAEGMEVVTRTDTTAHLRKQPPPLDKRILLGGLLTLGVVSLVYIRWHARQYRVINVLLEVTMDGEVVTERY